jgi:polyhydroxyalkanoate synthase
MPAAPRTLPQPAQPALARLGLEREDYGAMAGHLGVTPKETIHVHGTLKVQHFLPMSDSVYRVPVLIVTSLVNQPYILDLVPGQSMVEYLLQSGYDVYMAEWGRPRREHADYRLETYVQELLPETVQAVQADSGEAQLSIIGYCLGGLLAVLYSALNPNGPLQNLVCMAAPVNSDGLESLKAWMGPDFRMDELLAQHGNVPADWVQNALRALRPLGKVAGSMNLLNQLHDSELVRSNLRMTKWETDNIPFAGAAFRQLVNDFLRDNQLVKGQMALGGQRVDLARIRVPFLHLLARDDHITPYASSRDLVQRVGSRDKAEIVVKGGHVGLVAGRGAQQRMWPALNDWLAPRSV